MRNVLTKFQHQKQGCIFMCVSFTVRLRKDSQFFCSKVGVRVICECVLHVDDCGSRYLVSVLVELGDGDAVLGGGRTARPQELGPPR